MKLDSISDLKDLINWNEYKGGKAYDLDLYRHRLRGADKEDYLLLRFFIHSKVPFESLIKNKKIKFKFHNGCAETEIESLDTDHIYIATCDNTITDRWDDLEERGPTTIIPAFNLGNVKVNKTALRIEDAVSNEECVNIFSKIIDFMKFIGIPLEKNFKALYNRLNECFNRLQKILKKKFPFIIPAFMEACKKELTNEDLLYIFASDL